MLKKNKCMIAKIIFAICILAIFVVACRSFSFWLQEAEVENDLWKTKTSPLPAEKIRDLCEKFSLSTSDPLCDIEQVVYAGDFYSIIDEAFMRDSGELMTYDEVSEILGDYLDNCESPVQRSNGTEYFRCQYDLKGDEVFFIGAYFEIDGTLTRLNFNLEWP